MKRNMIFTVTIVLILVWLSGCMAAGTATPEPTPKPPTSVPEPTATPIVYSITLSVLDQLGEPLPGARIIRGDAAAYADERGIWTGETQETGFSAYVWDQGYLLSEVIAELVPGENRMEVTLEPDAFGLQPADLELEGYELAFVEDFQDNYIDCTVAGNGNVLPDEDEPGNYLLLADLRNLNESFSCTNIGPVDVQDGILEVSFKYPEIRYDDFKEGDGGYFNWQGFFTELRNGFSVSGYAIEPSWGATLQITDYREAEWDFPITMQQSFQEKRWYVLYSKYEGPKLEVRLNGELKFTYLNMPLSGNDEGAAFGAYNQADIQFDNIKLWVPVE